MQAGEKIEHCNVCSLQEHGAGQRPLNAQLHCMLSAQDFDARLLTVSNLDCIASTIAQ